MDFTKVKLKTLKKLYYSKAEAVFWPLLRFLAKYFLKSGQRKIEKMTKKCRFWAEKGRFWGIFAEKIYFSKALAKNPLFFSINYKK